jgi:hypothetical protein
MLRQLSERVEPLHPTVHTEEPVSGRQTRIAYLRRRLTELSESAESTSPASEPSPSTRRSFRSYLQKIGEALGDDFEKAKECLACPDIERFVRSLPMPYVSFDEASGGDRTNWSGIHRQPQIYKNMDPHEY